MFCGIAIVWAVQADELLTLLPAQPNNGQPVKEATASPKQSHNVIQHSNKPDSQK